jgi:ribonuclease HI
MFSLELLVSKIGLIHRFHISGDSVLVIENVNLRWNTRFAYESRRTSRDFKRDQIQELETSGSS